MCVVVDGICYTTYWIPQAFKLLLEQPLGDLVPRLNFDWGKGWGSFGQPHEELPSEEIGMGWTDRGLA